MQVFLLLYCLLCVHTFEIYRIITVITITRRSLEFDHILNPSNLVHILTVSLKSILMLPLNPVIYNQSETCIQI